MPELKCFHPFCDKEFESNDNLWRHASDYSQHSTVYKSEEHFIQALLVINRCIGLGYMKSQLLRFTQHNEIISIFNDELNTLSSALTYFIYPTTTIVVTKGGCCSKDIESSIQENSEINIEEKLTTYSLQVQNIFGKIETASLQKSDSLNISQTSSSHHKHNHSHHRPSIIKHSLSIVNTKYIDILDKLPSTIKPKQTKTHLTKQQRVLDINYEAIASSPPPTTTQIFNSSNKYKNTNPGNETVIPNHSYSLTGVINELSIISQSSSDNDNNKPNNNKPSPAVKTKKIIKRKVKKNKEIINVIPPTLLSSSDDDDDIKPIPPELIRSKPIQDTNSSNAYSDTSDAEIPFYLNPKIEINELPFISPKKEGNIQTPPPPPQSQQHHHKKREIVTSDDIGIIDDSTYNDESSSLLLDSQLLHSQHNSGMKQRKRIPIQAEPSPISKVKNDNGIDDDVGIIDDPCFSDDNDEEDDNDEYDEDENDEEDNNNDDENIDNFIQRSSSESSYDEAGNHIKTKKGKKRISKKYVDYKDQLTDTWWKRANNQLWSNDDDDTLLPYTEDDMNNELNALNALRTAEINNNNNQQSKKTTVATTITPSKIKRPTQTKSYSKTSNPTQ